MDRFHFNSQLESAFADALRHHLLTEAEKALQKSMAAALDFKDMLKEQNKNVQEKFHYLVQKTQQMYVDKWIEFGAEALQQTKQSIRHDWVNITAPMHNAFKAWSEDVQTMLSESTEPPLKVVMLHHWDQIAAWISNHEFTFNTLQPTLNNNHPVWSTLQNLAMQSKDGINELVAACESEVRDMWMNWHLQFMPVLE